MQCYKTKKDKIHAVIDRYEEVTCNRDSQYWLVPLTIDASEEISAKMLKEEGHSTQCI